jgi:hypothetical protein
MSEASTFSVSLLTFTRNSVVTGRLPGASSGPYQQHLVVCPHPLGKPGRELYTQSGQSDATDSMAHLFWHKSGKQLMGVPLCFQSTPDG